MNLSQRFIDKLLASQPAHQLKRSKTLDAVRENYYMSRLGSPVNGKDRNGLPPQINKTWVRTPSSEEQHKEDA